MFMSPFLSLHPRWNQGIPVFSVLALSGALTLSMAFATDRPPEESPPLVNPHAGSPGPNTPLPSGIVGLALQITATRIGDPAVLIIRAVHPAGPAARAGVTHGEEVLAVDGAPVNGKTHQEVVALIRGDVGSSVNLDLQGPQGRRSISLMRVSEEQLMEQTPPVM
jgi:S1-C subfamily serine protease